MEVICKDESMLSQILDVLSLTELGAKLDDSYGPARDLPNVVPITITNPIVPEKNGEDGWRHARSED